MALINLISEAYIRENTVFSKNLDTKDIANNIGISQDMFLEPILGSTFYDEIQTKYSAQTLNANETALVLEIKPFLAYKAAVISLPFIHYQIKNKGIQTQSGDNSSPADNSVMFYLKKELENRAEWYNKRLERYLYLNQTLFPTYQSQTGNQDITADKSSSTYDSGFATYPDNNSHFNGFYN